MNLKHKALSVMLAGGILALFTPSQSVSAQNIVTIFGQEKIEKTDEGEVFHHFRDGLFLRGPVNPGTLFNGQDMIAWLYATEKFTTPRDGETLSYNYSNASDITVGQPFRRNNVELAPVDLWTWTSISADSSGVFRHPYLRSAYLYTAYESPVEQIALLETTGGTRTYINGFPYEGDHYDFGYTLTPVKLKKGLNEIVYTSGRFGKVTSKLVKPEKTVMFTQRDMTVPDLIIGDTEAKWAAIRVLNVSEKPLKGLTIRATLESGESVEYKTNEVMPLSVRKLKYQLPAIATQETGNVNVQLELLDKSGKLMDQTQISLRKVLPSVHHERTFISTIDGSVQYYSVAPAIRENQRDTKAMVLTVHGAGVEARNQARAYQCKDWTDIIAATNRRPYGFNWEEWGRLDALEVLEDARRVYNPDLSKTYLTGHSMGGHGTWVLGTTYPDKFAAIAPCAGYPDVARYGSGLSDVMHEANPVYNAFERGANGGRIKTMAENLKQSGVYIFHGDADRVVLPEQARQMRELLGTFHTDFCYYEYPGGEHWFGDISVDWPLIFDYFKAHTIPAPGEVKEIDFITASPGISSTDYWVGVEQQLKPFDFSRVKVKQIEDTIRVESIENIALLTLDMPALTFTSEQVLVDIEGQQLAVAADIKVLLKLEDGVWKQIPSIHTKQKYSGRYGGFKYAYTNHVVLVYSTKGTAKENEWYRNKARFDAETFYYRGNGSMDVIPDTEYSLTKYAGRNVVIYGNKDTNRAWNLLLKDAPIQVAKNKITAGTHTLTGDDLGTYFVYPHPGNENALVGVVAGTGDAGMWATSPNNYISGITGFPDVMIFRADILKDGLDAVEAAGYFDNNWSLNGLF
ncbi:MAG: prolyl oligopeptidase family serine peptidase [Tannerellaceae bacterium]|nr:prolyl oligopeptidase family serine peptidase [Tannerellaceae bacterium]